METNIARTFAALSATNEAILYAKSPEELYRQVCEAAFSSGDFLATAIFSAEPGSHVLRFATGFGEDIVRLRSIDISIVADTPEGSGVCGQAFRDQKLTVSNDFLNDTRSLAWRKGACEAQVGAAAALPLICNGHSVGVLLVTRREAGSLNGQMVSLLERMSANISYALDNFEREAARKGSERALRRLNRMFGALSATNEAIMRAKSRAELFEMVCEAAVHGAKFASTTVALAETDSLHLRVVASTGPGADEMRLSEFAITESLPQGRGLTGTAFRTRRPCVSNDFLTDERTRLWHDNAIRSGVRSSAVLPLLNGDRAAGVLIFHSSELGTFTPELVELLQRLAENVSFALGNFDRADEKAKAEKQKDRLTGMFEALSATNEAIIRVKTRAELFELVCEAAVLGGMFASATIALAEPGGEFLRIAATKGLNYERMRGRRFATSAADPEGRGLTGTSFRTREPCIMNGYLADERTAHWRILAREDGTRSGASFPLLQNGNKAVGVLLFLSRDEGAFTDDLVELLARLAENV